ncbi:MAG: hypothetical protein QOH53_732, partial [Ilumatobacteraceae bacterium]
MVRHRVAYWHVLSESEQQRL